MRYGGFNLPDNANIVCTENKISEQLAESLPIIPEVFKQSFTVLDAQDKDDIEIQWNNETKKR